MLTINMCASYVDSPQMNSDQPAGEVPYGTLDLMVLKTLHVMGALTRLRDRQAHRAGGSGIARAQPGHDLSRAAAARTEGLDYEQVGHQRDEAARALFHHYPLRPPAAG